MLFLTWRPLMNKLFHTIYRSRAIKVFSDEELIGMLEEFRKRNAAINVTGMLLYDEDVFFQVIEGEK